MVKQVYIVFENGGKFCSIHTDEAGAKREQWGSNRHVCEYSLNFTDDAADAMAMYGYKQRPEIAAVQEMEQARNNQAKNSFFLLCGAIAAACVGSKDSDVRSLGEIALEEQGKIRKADEAIFAAFAKLVEAVRK